VRLSHSIPTAQALAGFSALARASGAGTAVAHQTGAIMRLLALGLLCLSLATPRLAAARACGDDVNGVSVPCDCGDVLVGSRTLGDDDPITGRICPGIGLLVRVAPDVRGATLELTGHTISGSGHGVGIQVLQGGAGGLTISGPGAVSGFDTGVQATNGSLARVTQILAERNRHDGFFVVGAAFAVTSCEASNNGRDGFTLRGRDYRLDGSRASANGRHGFNLAGRNGSIGDGAGNEAAGNRRDGIRLAGRGHALDHSVATANGARGIRTRATASSRGCRRGSVCR
jgi:hypothetical protein